MIKNLIFLLATIGLIANISGCTSKKAQDESEVVENAAVDKIDAESQALSGADAPVATTDDASLQAALGESGPTPAPTLDAAAPAPTTTDTVALDGTAAATTEPVTTSPDIAAAPTLDESSLNDIPPPTDPSVNALTETPLTSEPPPIAEATPEAKPAPVESLGSSSGSTFADAPVAKPGSQLKKVSATVPYQAGTGWINTVYVARPGEKLKDISMKIFGADKAKDLKKITENSYLKSRSVKAGDKVYYVSPNRPDDSSKMLLYYEDMGMVPETYVAKKGDKLKKISKEILGYDKAWVEVWTSNPVESKDKLAEGETLRYWRSTTTINNTDLAQNAAPHNGAAQLVDQTQMPAPPPQNVAANTPPPQAQSPTQDMNSLPPPPDMPAPPPPDMAASTPPPPPDANVPPPPPPPDMAQPAAAKAKKKFTPGAGDEEASAVEGLDQDTLMSLGAVGVLTVALAFVLIRRRKKRASEQGMSEHNVGT